MKYLFLLFGIIFWTSIIAQEESSSIKVTLINSNYVGIPDVTYILFKGNDSITSATTDKNGEFYFEYELEFNSAYALTPLNNPDGMGDDDIKFMTDYAPRDFIFQFQNLTVRREYRSQIAYYQPKDTKKIEEFEVEFLLDLIKENPEICIEFSQGINRSETEKIALKRRKNFMKYLEENGVDMSYVQFNDETHFIKVFSEDQRSRIECAIASLDSKCN